MPKSTLEKAYVDLIWMIDSQLLYRKDKADFGSPKFTYIPSIPVSSGSSPEVVTTQGVPPPKLKKV